MNDERSCQSTKIDKCHFSDYGMTHFEWVQTSIRWNVLNSVDHIENQIVTDFIFLQDYLNPYLNLSLWVLPTSKNKKIKHSSTIVHIYLRPICKLWTSFNTFDYSFFTYFWIPNNNCRVRVGTIHPMNGCGQRGDSRFREFTHHISKNFNLQKKNSMRKFQ